MAAKKTHKRVDSFEGFNLDRNALPNDPRIDEIVTRYMNELRIRSKDRDHMPGGAVVVRYGKYLVT